MKKYLTLMVIPHNESHVKELHLSRPVLVGVLSAVGITLCALLFFAFGFVATMGQREGFSTLKKENAAMQRQYVLMQEKLDNMRNHIDVLTEKDRRMRAWVEMAEPGEEIRQVGVGGGDDVSPLWENDVSQDVSKLLTTTYTNMDQLLREARFLETSFDAILDSLNQDSKLRQHMPSITPVQKESPRISSGFGTRRDPFTGRLQFHNGIDYPGRKGTPIVATADGMIDKVAYDSRLGWYVALDHGNGLRTVYGHLHKKPPVKRGARVKRGQVIGGMGKTGRSTATHLHYSVIRNRKAENPKLYIFDQKSRSLF